jgi:hypothetical protein
MENIYCNHLNLGFELNLDYVKNLQHIHENRSTVLHHQVPQEYYDPQLVDLLDSVNMYIWVAEVFYTPPNSTLGLHIDGPEVFSFGKLNWVVGAIDSTMAWYQLKDPEYPIITGKTNFGITYGKVEIDQCELVWKDQIGCPSLVEAGQFHMIDNHNSMGRWCLSHAMGDKDTCGLVPWAEANAKLSKYII